MSYIIEDSEDATESSENPLPSKRVYGKHWTTEENKNIGRVLEGKYKLVRPLSHGGMGTVYEANHLLLERKIAIKLIHSEIAEDEESVRRFHREARTAAAIGHNHIVDILEMGTTEQQESFIVMEYLEGQDLESLLREHKTIPEKRACHIMIQVLSALEAAHAKEIIHRDIKPANIFLTTYNGIEDYVKLVDFGISKVWGRGGITKALTRTGQVLGTPPYISPEQALGDKAITSATDIWSSGVILYRMITGELPFFFHTLAKLLLAITQVDPLHPQYYNDELSSELSELVMKALRKSPADRIESATVFRRALTPFSPETPDVTGLGATRFSIQAAPVVKEGTEDTPAPSTRDSISKLKSSLEKSRHKSVYIAALGIAGVAVATGVFWAILMLSGSATQSRPAPAPTYHHTEDSPEIRAALQSFAKVWAAKPIPTSSPETQKSYTFHLTVHPLSATVFIDGKEIGSGEQEFPIIPDETLHSISVQAPGYKEFSQKVSFKRDISFVVNLRPIGRNKSIKQTDIQKSETNNPPPSNTGMGRIDESPPF